MSVRTFAFSATLSRLIGLAAWAGFGFVGFVADEVLAEEPRVEVFGDGPDVLLIPGLSCGADVWQGTVEALESDYRLHVVTLPGFAGAAPRQAGPFLKSSRDELLAYIDQNDLERPAIVGHSLGAHLAYAMASHAPGAVGPLVAVDGLPFLGALQNPDATPETVRAQAEQMLAAFDGISRDDFERQNELSLRTMIRNAEDIARVASTSRQSDPATVGRAMYELMQTDLRADLAAIEQPVLQMGAFGGLPTPEMRQWMGDRYREQIAAAPNARFVEMPTLHFVMLDEPELFVRTLDDFLKQNLATAPLSAVRP
ncbi:MAG: alpha/beta hydrolase [Acidobacteriota bacterium]